MPYSSISIIIVIMLLGLTPAISNGQDIARPVQALQVTYQPIAKVIQSSRRLAYKAEHKLSFKVAGPVAEILVEEGQTVKPGQTLATLDTEEIDATEAQAQARYDLARKNLRRFEALHHKKLLSLEQLQQAETELAAAHAELRIAQFNRRYATINAPVQGLIIKRLIESNEMVSPHQTAFVLADETKGWVIRTGLIDRDIIRVQLGDNAHIKFDAYPKHTFKGIISEIGPAADPAIGTFEIEISLPASSLKLHSGFIGQITITPSKAENLALLPTTSIVSADNGLLTLFAIEGGKILTKQVEIAWLEQNHIAIRKGLQTGDYVVTEGAPFLKDGMAVKIIDSEEPLIPLAP